MELCTVNPATGEEIARYDEHTDEELTAVLDAATAAQRAWGALRFDDRAAVVERIAERFEARSEALAVLMATEMGKPLADGRAEVDKCAWACRHYAEHAEGYLADVPIGTGYAESYVHHVPLGVVLAVMPWNFPLWQVVRFAAPALMAGNVGVLKHAEITTGTAIAIEEILGEAGVPPGVFTTLRLHNERVAAVIAEPAVAAVTLTGSERAGSAVAAEAGRHLKKTVLELGGSDAYLVLEDVDVEWAAGVCASSRLINGGQSCIAAKRFLVVDAVHDRFVEALVANMAEARMGDPLAEGTTLGPMARLDLRDGLAAQVDDSVAAGASVALGGVVPDGPGAFYPATVLTDVRAGMPAADEEVFGPVAAVLRVADEREAVEVANSSPYGLGAAVLTGDVARGRAIAAERLDAGSCFVNALVASDPRLPFGGIKRSGYGRELADLGIKEFVNAKTVVVSG